MLTAFLMGVGGAPHCAAMCGLACAAALPKGVPWLTFVGRACGYATLGAVAAASAGWVSAWGRHVTFLQPLWVMALLACCLVGLWMAKTGMTPSSLDRLGRGLYMKVRQQLAPRFSPDAASHPVAKAALQWLAGFAWAALPCGLLYAAVMVAALAPSPLGGATVMLAFAVPSTLGVWAAPALLGWLRKRASPQADLASAATNPSPVPVMWLQQETNLPQGGMVQPTSAPDAWVDPRWAIRVSGLMMAGMAAWGAYHQVMAQWQAWCA